MFWVGLKHWMAFLWVRVGRMPRRCAATLPQTAIPPCTKANSTATILTAVFLLKFITNNTFRNHSSFTFAMIFWQLKNIFQKMGFSFKLQFAERNIWLRVTIDRVKIAETTLVKGYASEISSRWVSFFTYCFPAIFVVNPQTITCI